MRDVLTLRPLRFPSAYAKASADKETHQTRRSFSEAGRVRCAESFLRTDTGLAWRIVEAGNQLEIAKIFAAPALLSTAGTLNFYTLSAIERALLRNWHEGATPRA